MSRVAPDESHTPPEEHHRMPQASLTISLQDYEQLVREKRDLEAELVRVKVHNAIEVARDVDEKLNRAVGHALPIVRFAMAHLSPEAVHGWPRRDLEALIHYLAERPLPSIWSQMDEASWLEDARAFVAECTDWDDRRDRKLPRRPLPGLPGGRRAIAYLAHPIGRDLNLANARQWVKFLVDTTPYAICVPWMAYVLSLDDDEYRDRGMQDDLAILSQCDLVILCGGRMSDGMALEEAHARSLGKPILSLLHFGEIPPAEAPILSLPL